MSDKHDWLKGMLKSQDYQLGGKALKVSELSASEFASSMDLLKSQSDQEDGSSTLAFIKYRAFVVMMCLCYPDGSKVFDLDCDDDFHSVMNLPNDVLNEVFTIQEKLSQKKS